MGSLKSNLTGRAAGRMTAFDEKVYALCRRVRRGKVTTYGAIARAMNSQAYRAVGAALGRNPYAPKVPCHRVVGSDGRLTGFAGGLKKKRQMLEAEGVKVVDGRVDLKRYGFEL